MVIIRNFQYRPEAELAASVLENSGIKSLVSSDDCGVWRPSLATGTGGVNLLVREEDTEKAEEIIHSIED
jgi:hypothetical protein